MFSCSTGVRGNTREGNPEADVLERDGGCDVVSGSSLRAG